MKAHRLITLAFGSSALVACASTPGAKPSDMSAMQHEQAASAHEAEAAPHAEQYNPGAGTATTQCGGKGYSGPCWTSVSNPTEPHNAEAKKHHKMAADHRAAGQALRAAEAQSCVGISDEDRDISPFFHGEDITGVQPATVHRTGKNAGEDMVGATITFRAVPGLTAEWLQRIVDCHIARNNALGNDVPEMPYCPLVPKGITAKVSSTGDGFAVTISAPDDKTAQEVLRRAKSLKTGS